MLPKIYQHIDCSTLAGKTLNHCYSNFRDAYKAHPRPPFSQSDHNSILLLPSYRSKLKQEVSVLRTIQRWSDQLEFTLQDCFDHADWDMFWVASENNIDVYTETVTDFIKKCIGDAVPTVNIKTYPNQKLDRWQHSRKTEHANHNKVVIPSAKQSNRQNASIEKVESQFNGSDMRRMWQGLQTIRLQKENQPCHGHQRLGTGQAKHVLCPVWG